MASLQMILPPGLLIAQDVISEDEENALLAIFDGLRLSYSPKAPDNRRSSVSYGWKYDYAGDTFVPCPPLPDSMRFLLERAAAFAGVKPEGIVECLINRYEDGAVIPMHFDKPVFEYIIGVSLGAATEMHFLPEDTGAEAVAVPLARRSAYLLAGEARHVYRHGLPPQKATRHSVTFRTLSEEGRYLRESIGAGL